MRIEEKYLKEKDDRGQTFQPGMGDELAASFPSPTHQGEELKKECKELVPLSLALVWSVLTMCLVLLIVA